MRKNYEFCVALNKLDMCSNFFAQSPWMDFGHGEGELEIDNQGRLRISSFLAGNRAIGQQTPRIGGLRLKLKFIKSTSVGCASSSGSTSQLFLSLGDKLFFTGMISPRGISLR